MRVAFWLALMLTGPFALSTGFYVHYWLAVTYPRNLAFVGQRLDVFILLGAGFCLSGLEAGGCRLCGNEPRALAAVARQVVGRPSDRRASRRSRTVPARASSAREEPPVKVAG